ncbi:DUF2523 domain-containing protein [Variovorax terrae]|uniref:DUF2523 domain-containing protein n=1 Tax=Variovorax terrae TaxID=2923278 RepID=A0A9X2ANZ9_9BURK|nr:DUF2523 domain-containing protein [Variovorax terrae]MCJ0765333.1 DUF2523 domain-containing protein [Variovorax terrae]
MKLGTWLLAMLQPMIAKILISLGFSVVTITGLTAIVNNMKQQAVTAFGLLQPEMLQLFLLSGGAVGLGIILGACATKLMLWQIQNAVKILGVNPS